MSAEKVLMSITLAILLALYGVLYQKLLRWCSSLMIGISNKKRVAVRREPLGAQEKQLARSQSYSPLTTFERVRKSVKTAKYAMGKMPRELIASRYGV